MAYSKVSKGVDLLNWVLELVVGWQKPRVFFSKELARCLLCPELRFELAGITSRQRHFALAEQSTYPMFPILVEIETSLPGLLPVRREIFIAGIGPIVIYLMNYARDRRRPLHVIRDGVMRLGDFLLS
jgi:hypothetical protein